MEKFVICATLYVSAFFCIYIGINLIGDADWPKTAVQLNGAIILIIGCAAKLAGHVVLFSTTKAY